MLKTPLLHPLILATLGRCGHGSQILVADGNFPFCSAPNPAASVVYLNLSPGVIGVVPVLDALLSAVVIESAAVMAPPDGTDGPLFAEFARLLPHLPAFERLERFAFYERTRVTAVALVVATGEQQRFSNILLTIGVVRREPEASS